MGDLGVEVTLVSFSLLCVLMQEWCIFAQDSGVGTDGPGSASACPLPLQEAISSYFPSMNDFLGYTGDTLNKEMNVWRRPVYSSTQ